MKRLLLYGLLGLLAYALFMLIQFPATQLVGLMSQHIPGLTAREARGTAINGSAQGLRVGNTELPAVSWRWHPTALLMGRLAYRLEATEPGLDLHAVASINPMRRLLITDLRGKTTLSRAIALVSRAPLLLEGELELAVDELRLSSTGAPTALEGTVRLRDAYTSVGRAIALGDFEAILTTEAPTIVGNVKDLQGPLALTGNLTLAPDGRYRFTGTLGVRDNNNRDLRQALAFLGRPDADGTWLLDFSGALPR